MKIVEAFKLRKPWAAALIALLFEPMIGMLYLNRGWLGLWYFIAMVVAMALPFGMAQVLHMNPTELMLFTTTAVGIVGAVHCWKLAKQGTPKPFKWYARWYNILVVFFLLPLMVSFAFRTFFYEPFHVPSESMLPTIHLGDYFFVDKRAYGEHGPQRGDVVVFHNPKQPKVALLKRVIGLPGEKLQIKPDAVYINGVALARADQGRVDVGKFAMERFVEKLPEGGKYSVLQLSSNPNASDSPIYDIQEGEYFVMGDNRDNSKDSRYLNEVGYIPRAAILGKVTVVMWNSQTYKLGYEPVE